MRIGIEHEFFVRSASGPPSLDEIEALAAEGSASAGAPGREGVLFTFETGVGRVEVKNDAYTHLLEIAFPPLDCLEQGILAFAETVTTVDRVLERVGLSAVAGAIAPSWSEAELVRAAATPEQSRRLDLILARRLPDRARAVRHAHAVAAATQFHFELDAAAFLPVSAQAYRFQYVIPLGFSNSGAGAIHSLRALLLRDSFDASEWHYGYPQFLPQTVEQHRRRLERSAAGRDYSFIAWHARGTFEFRACDSQPSATSLAEVAALQACIAAEALAGVPDRDALTTGEALFWDACEQGAVERSIVLQDLADLERRANSLPAALRKYAARAIVRVAEALESRSVP